MYQIINKIKITKLGFFLNAITFLGFYIKNSSFNQKCIAKIINPITKTQFLTNIKLTYSGIKYA